MDNKKPKPWLQANPQKSSDDTQPGDLAYSDDRDGPVVTRVRDHRGFRLERRDPFGHWYCPELEKDIGTFTSEVTIRASIDEYLSKNPEKAIEDSTSSNS